jgi:hypothetical protein
MRPVGAFLMAMGKGTRMRMYTPNVAHHVDCRSPLHHHMPRAADSILAPTEVFTATSFEVCGRATLKSVTNPTAGSTMCHDGANGRNYRREEIREAMSLSAAIRCSSRR